MSLIEIEKKIKFKNFVDLNKEEALEVLEYRNLPEIRKNMLTQEIITKDNHFKFINGLKSDREKEYYAVVFNEQLIGSVYLTDINKHSAYWGFYLGEKPVLGIGSIIEYFFIEFIFNLYNISHLSCEVFDSNKGVIKLHRRFGFEIERLIKNYAFINNITVNAVQMGLEKTKWKNFYKCKVRTLLNKQMHKTNES